MNMINPKVRSLEFLTPQVKLALKKFLQQQCTVDYFAVSFSQRKLRLLTFNMSTPTAYWITQKTYSMVRKVMQFYCISYAPFYSLYIQVHSSDSILEIFTLWMKCNEAIISNVVNLWCAHIQSLPMSCLIPCVPHHNPGRFFIVTSWYLNTVWNSNYFLDSKIYIWLCV